MLVNTAWVDWGFSNMRSVLDSRLLPCKLGAAFFTDNANLAPCGTSAAPAQATLSVVERARAS